MVTWGHHFVLHLKHQQGKPASKGHKMNGIFEVTATDNKITPNICEKATVTVTGYNVPNAVDAAHNIVSKWSKATGIPVVCDGYSIIKNESSKHDDSCTLTIEFYVI